MSPSEKFALVWLACGVVGAVVLVCRQPCRFEDNDRLDGSDPYRRAPRPATLWTHALCTIGGLAGGAAPAVDPAPGVRGPRAPEVGVLGAPLRALAAGGSARRRRAGRSRAVPDRVPDVRAAGGRAVSAEYAVPTDKASCARCAGTGLVDAPRCPHGAGPDLLCDLELGHEAQSATGAWPDVGHRTSLTGVGVLDYGARQMVQAIRDEERDAVVAWLRAEPGRDPWLYSRDGETRIKLSESLERGDHR